jgi:hypothetical protein
MRTNILLRNSNHFIASALRAVLLIVIFISVASSTAVAGNQTSGNNLTMLMWNGYNLGVTNDVKFTWDGTRQDAATFANGTGPSNATISSDEPLNGWRWYAKNVQVVGPGTYWVDLDGSGPGTTRYEATVLESQIGAHLRID